MVGQQINVVVNCSSRYLEVAVYAMSDVTPTRLPWTDVVARGDLAVALIRHGRTRWNAERRFLGATDVPLDVVGRAQAFVLAQALPKFDHVYASPLSRAMDTARALHPDPTPIPAFQELSQGDLEGLTREDAVARFPEFFSQWSADPVSVRVPGGETLEEVADRSLRALQGLVRQHRGGEVIAVVTHQMVIATLLCGLSDTPLRSWRRRTVENASLAVLAWDGGQLSIVEENWSAEANRGA
jgi:broad specificity phosphatase PhoE